jgi:predicted nucleotide-binding protein
MEIPPSMDDVPSHDVRGNLRESQWCRDGDWYVWRERTTRPLALIKVDATRVLFRGLAALTTTHEWRGQVLHIWSFGCDGTLRLEGGFLTLRMRFDLWGPATFIPFLKSKILSEVAADVIEVAGGTFFGSKEVFIIHGHNEAAREQLKLLILSFGLKPIVLVEQSDGGMTIIEKFEYYASICSFAFALMTPDDNVKGTDSKDTTWHPRQNVILELGWFMARLGRSRVMLLSQGDLDIPSDLNGILYLPFKNSVMDVAPQLSYRLREAGLM